MGGATDARGSASKSGIERERETSWSLESMFCKTHRAAGQRLRAESVLTSEQIFGREKMALWKVNYITKYRIEEKL